MGFIGVAEILGALGLILPVATGVYDWLAPVTAIGLGLLLLLAAGFHARRGEGTDSALAVILLLLAGFVLNVRWPLLW